MSTPTPSDAAMAAAEEIEDYNFKPVWPEGAESSYQRLPERVNATALFIDRHFAPLREELARLDRDKPWLTEANATVATLRASNDKLRAALESSEAHDCLARLVLVLEAAGISRLSQAVQLGQISWYHKCNDATEWAKRIIAERAALAPERKETT